MLCPTKTILSAFASFRTASTARAKRVIENFPSAGDPLWPCPGRSSVMTWYFFENAGTCASHDEESHVQPCTKMTVFLPDPADEEWMLVPSTDVASSGSVKTAAANRAETARR